jgi:hypothetical protein
MPNSESPDPLNCTSVPPTESSKPSLTETKTSPTVQTPPHGNELSVRGAVSPALTSTRTKKALDRFETAVGGRESVIDALEMATLGKREEHFLRLLYDPAREQDSLGTIARDAGMRPAEVIDLFRNSAFAKAHAVVAGQLSEALPAVISDITAKSIDHEGPCADCNAQGIITCSDGEERQCLTCRGTGVVFKESDLDRQKIVLEATGVLKKGGGVNVQVNTQVNNSPTGSIFSKFVRGSDEAAYNVDGLGAKSAPSGDKSPEVVDGEVS